MINPDICSCCGEIWNRENLKNIPLGKHELHLCPDCYAEYIRPFSEILSGLEAHKWNKCSGCGDVDTYPDNSCPNCGLYMVKSQKVRD